MSVPDQNRRKAKRHQIKLKAFLKPTGRINTETILRDISESGAFLITKEFLTVGSKLLLYVQLPVGEREQLCILPAIIARIEKRPGINVHGFGVEFDQKTMSRDAKATLQAYLKRNLGEDSSATPSEDTPE